MAKKKKEEKEIVKEEVTPQEQAFDFAEASRADIAAAQSEAGLAPVVIEAPDEPRAEDVNAPHAMPGIEYLEHNQTLAEEFKKPVEQKSARIQRKEENARKMVDALSAKEEELGRELTRQEIADYADSKGLWAYQSLYNKKGNWADAFGGRDVFGSLNDDTYELIKKDLKARSRHRDVVRKEEERPNRVIGTIKQADGTNRHITRAHQTLHQNLWGEGTDINNMSPEQSSQFIDLLRASGHVIPEEFKVEGNTSMNDLLIDLMPYVDEDELEYEMRKLGYYNGDSLVAPHKETYEEMMARRARAEAEAKLQSEQKALARRQMRLGFADLAAGIGDMIKAGGGAKVDPRDYKAMYDSLTQQQQINYNNYLTRLKALEEQEKAKADRAYQERLAQQQRDFQAEQARLGREHQEHMAEEERKWRMAMAAQEAALEEAKAKNKKKGGGGAITTSSKGINITVGNKTFNFGTKDAANAALSSLYGAILPAISDKDTDGNYKLKQPFASVVSGFTGDGTDNPSNVIAVVSAALNHDLVLNNSSVLSKIHNILGSSGKLLSENTPAPQQPGINPVSSGGGNDKIRIKNKRTGEEREYSRAAYDSLLPMVKNQYEVIQ